MRSLDSELIANLSRFILSRGKNFVVWHNANAIHHDTFLNSHKSQELNKAVDTSEETFSEMIIRKIRENGIKNSDCYKKAHIDRRLFSKIISDPFYTPQKTTAISFALSLELSLLEFEDMLRKAGFALSNTYPFDLIIKYLILNNIYDINFINEILFHYEQSPLGY